MGKAMGAERGLVSEQAATGTAWRVLVGTGLALGVALSGCGEGAEGVALPGPADDGASSNGTDVTDETGSTGTTTLEEGTVVPRAELELSLHAVTFQNGQYVATGATGGERAETESVILTSPDAETWSLRYRGGNEVLAAVAFGGGHWVAAGWGVHALEENGLARSRSILLSEDAATWRVEESPESNGFREVVWTGSEFLLRGEVEGGLALWASETGAEWAERGERIVPEGLTVGVPGVAGHFTGAIGLTVNAGLSWSRSLLEERRWVRGLWAEGDGFAGTAWYDCCAGESPSQLEYYSLHSPDGLEWSVQRTNGTVPIAVARMGERSVGISVRSGSMLYRGANGPWQETLPTRVNAVAAGNKFVAVGHGIWSSEDGQTWVPATLPELD